jgi:ribonuclease Z
VQRESEVNHGSSLKAGPYTVRGISVGGVYTCIQVPELSVLLDAGVPLRAFCAADRIFLSHGHVDHSGGLAGLLGVRGMMHKSEHAQLFMPEEIAADVEAMLEATTRMQRYPLKVRAMPMRPGSEESLGNTLWVRAFRTHHPVPSLGYQFFRRVQKLKPQFLGLPGSEIGARKARGEDLFDSAEHLELAYATDTLLRVIDTNPSMLKSRVLVMECTFYDERKSLADSRAGCHVHLDELREVCERFENEHIVLMHTSQIYKPREAREILLRRCPKSFTDRVQILAPTHGPWL